MTSYIRAPCVGIACLALLAGISGHIIVKNSRTMLLGIVDNAADLQIAEVRARDVTGVFEVENSLTVLRHKRSAR